jgi:signal transduction histidine kinase
MLFLVEMLFWGVSNRLQAQNTHPVLDSLRELLHNSTDQRTRLQLFNALARAHNTHDPSSKAINYARKAVALAQELKDWEAEATAYTVWGDLHAKVSRPDWAGALAYYRKALKIRQKLVKDNPGNLQLQMDLAALMSDIAYNYWQWGKLPEALRYYENCMELGHQIYQADSAFPEAEVFIALRHHNMGAIYWAQTDYRKALHHYLKALEYFERIQNKGRISMAMVNIGLVYLDCQEDSLALHYCRQGLLKAKEAQHTRYMAYAQNCLGRALERKGQTDSALYYFDQSINTYGQLQDLGGLGMNYHSIGNVYQKQKAYTESLTAYQKALLFAEQIQSRYWIAMNHQQIALLHFETNDWFLANYNIQKALQIAQTEGYREIVRESYRLLADIYQAVGNTAEALAFYKRYVAVKDSIFSEEKYKQLNQLKLQYESERQEQENALLRSEKSLKITQLKQAKRSLWLLTAGVVGLLGVAVLLLYSRQFLQKTRRKLQLQNEEIAQQAEELQMQAQALAEVNEVKDRLFSIIAHDLRSPLAQLEGVLGLVQNQRLSAEELQFLLPRINQNVRYTTDLTNNLLHWAKSQLQGIVTDPEVFDLHEIVQANIRLFEQVAQQKGLRLEAHITAPSLAYADRDMIALVLRNLISNALKFSRQGGVVSLQATPLVEAWQITIQDSGVGISLEQQTHLFSLKVGSTLGTAQEKGTGLGLHLCQTFVKQNGGYIGCKSTPGEGSEFYFTVPRANLTAPQNGQSQHHPTTNPSAEIHPLG